MAQTEQNINIDANTLRKFTGKDLMECVEAIRKYGDYSEAFEAYQNKEWGLPNPTGMRKNVVINKYNISHKILRNKHRKSILELLISLNGAHMSVGEIHGHCNIQSQPVTSHHLKILHDANLVCSHREWKHVYYAINLSTLKKQNARINKKIK
jgi:DNA-binding transcriptional ArsR family regulator